MSVRKKPHPQPGRSRGFKPCDQYIEHGGELVWCAKGLGHFTCHSATIYDSLRFTHSVLQVEVSRHTTTLYEWPNGSRLHTPTGQTT